MKFLSICIPTYEMHGLGEKFLRQSFDILKNQTFKDFEIVISDHSKTDTIEELCNQYKNSLDIKYIRNDKNLGNSSANINNAIKHAKGKLIKILFQDDFLYSVNSLEEIVKNFDLDKDNWLVTACESTEDGKKFIKPFYPRYHDKIHLDEGNTISSPSVLTVKNKDPLLFDENLIWGMDTDYYKRYYDKSGEPKILNKINVVNRIGSHQITNTLANDALRQKEYGYILKKYKVRHAWSLIALRKIKMMAKRLKKIIQEK